MYEEFYHLKEEPFRLSPNSRFCFKHPTYKKAFACMQYALHRGEGFVMVTGQPGTGKTALITDLTSTMSDGHAVFANISSTQLEADDLLRMVAYTFGLDGKTEIKSTLLQDLETFFRKTQASGRRPLLIIDEAQGLSRTALEELHQRIVASCHLDPLTEKDTGEYIKHRLSQVEWRNDPQLDPAIFPLIRQFSDGIPRWINLICSRLMLHGMDEELHHLGVPETREVLQGLIDEQLPPSRLYAGNSNLLNEMAADQEATPSSLYAAPAAEAAAAPVTPAPEPVSQPAPAPVQPEPEVAAEPQLEGLDATPAEDLPQAAAEPDAPKEAQHAPVDEPPSQPSFPGKSSAMLLYTQLQPLVTDKVNSERLWVFLDFLDGKEVEGKVLSLPVEERETLAETGLKPWFQSTHGSFNNAGLSEDILEIMGLAAWLKQIQPDISNDQLETIGLMYKYMQSE